ncbi:MAG: Tex family protein [Spirochaetales bacterium]
MVKNRDIVPECAESLSLRGRQVQAVAELLDEGATIPFIARYRKERTGSLDEEVLRSVRDTLATLAKREERREYITNQIESQGKMTPELAAAIDAAATLAELEDLYLPFKRKRTTRAEKARQAGLEPLALEIFAQEGRDWKRRVERFLCEAYPDAEAVVAGCRDIIAGLVNEDAKTRAALRELFARRAILATRKAADNPKFEDYYEFAQPVGRLKGYRLLGALRAQNEGAVRLSLAPEEPEALGVLRRLHFRGEPEVEAALEDAYARLLAPSLENELLKELKEQADAEAIGVFAENVRQVLLEAPLGAKNVLAIDPGFRTGCKIAALGEQGDLLEHGVIYPTEPHKKLAEAEAVVRRLVERHAIEAIAIGNGTGGRETEAFIRGLSLPGVIVVLVNESSASVYSASPVAKKEFPELDLTVRGAISIGRRLKDPLAELVKIDPKSIGVGQYQHDVDQKALQAALDDTVSECVNKVGVDVNQASEQLLTYVSGLTTATAANLVKHRSEAGPFGSRAQIKKVAGIGPKAFEQAAGFLRIPGAKNPLDASAVHPESYEVAKKILAAAGVTAAGVARASEALEAVRLEEFVTEEVGIPTLSDIVAELKRPGRDPRADFEAPSFDARINAIEDLAEGMVLEGVVTNVTQFGAFVDIGVHQDGLVHVSEIADRFVKDPAEELHVRQKVRVKVVSVDAARKRIGLSIKQV